MRHVIEVNGRSGLLQELDTSDSNLGELSRPHRFKVCMLLITRWKWQSLIIQEALKPLTLIDSVNAAFLVGFVSLNHHYLIKTDRSRESIFWVLWFLPVAFRYFDRIEHI